MSGSLPYRDSKPDTPEALFRHSGYRLDRQERHDLRLELSKRVSDKARYWLSLHYSNLFQPYLHNVVRKQL